ncbi:MAG: hypothetical protein KTR35_22945 [Gammaproteobacteria bacterium]|nr:hypothetical protein [Gammaproteobacteria bacterium]
MGENSLLWRGENQQGYIAAIKIPRDIENRARNNKRQKRFKNEIDTLLHLQHAGVRSVMPIIDHGHTNDGKPWYAMPIATPLDLSSSFSDRLKLLSQLAEVVENLHKIGIEHLDIKLGNLMTIDNALVLSDFGHSKQAADPASLLSDKQTLDPDRPWFDYDMYSLGKACWEMLTGLKSKSLCELSSPEDNLQPFWPTIDTLLIEKLQILIFSASSEDPLARPNAAQFNQKIQEVYNSIKPQS